MKYNENEMQKMMVTSYIYITLRFSCILFLRMFIHLKYLLS